jgi:hypothetical protein
VLALLLVAPTADLAQQPQSDFSAALANSTPEQRAKFLTAYMKNKLSLTADHLPKLEAINLDTAQQMEPVLKGTQGKLLKLRAAHGIEQKKETALQGVLTPAQFQTFLASREDLKQQLEEHLMAKKSGSGGN